MTTRHKIDARSALTWSAILIVISVPLTTAAQPGAQEYEESKHLSVHHGFERVGFDETDPAADVFVKAASRSVPLNFSLERDHVGFAEVDPENSGVLVISTVTVPEQRAGWVDPVGFGETDPAAVLRARNIWGCRSIWSFSKSDSLQNEPALRYRDI